MMSRIPSRSIYRTLMGKETIRVLPSPPGYGVKTRVFLGAPADPRPILFPLLAPFGWIRAIPALFRLHLKIRNDPEVEVFTEFNRLEFQKAEQEMRDAHEKKIREEMKRN